MQPSVIDFDEATHTYKVNGAVIPSVTQILGATGLVSYYNRDPWYMTRGDAVHKDTRKIDLGTIDWTKVDPRIEGFLEGYERFKAESGIHWERGEERLFHPIYGYCGTPDRWNPGLWDIKCGQGDTMQLEAYAELLRANGIDPGREGHLLNLNEDGTYRVTPYKFDRTRRGIWLSAVTVYQYRKERGLL